MQAVSSPFARDAESDPPPFFSVTQAEIEMRQDRALFVLQAQGMRTDMCALFFVLPFLFSFFLFLFLSLLGELHLLIAAGVVGRSEW
jgi:hypothetical protein